MGSRPRSPSAYPAPWWVQPPGEPHPAKRLRSQEPEGPDFEMAPSLEDLTGPQAAGAVSSVVVLAAGCALKVPLDDVDLVLEPEPTSVLQVSLGGHTLMLVPEALLGSGDQHLGGQGRFPVGLEPGAFLGALGEVVAIEQEFCACSPEIAAQEEVYDEDDDDDDDDDDDNEVDPELPPPWMDHAADPVVGLRPVAAGVSSPFPQGLILEPSTWAPTPSPERRSPGPYFSLKLRLLEPLPNSPLQPLPPSPNPSPQGCPQRPPGPHPKARRRLFLD
ncbi:PREDICTED: proline-rich protein 23A-like [Condylura cristata]|uniref:proline-rich protein 23A-like n=1 Tax=Condylura cristata TaxID=143302 RepID=UPI000334742F|nr:PREDICTED: proline-rich protein 23A-like [Condylura cristata]